MNFTHYDVLRFFCVVLWTMLVEGMETQYRELALKLHNDFRSREGASDMIKLVWDDELEKQSAERANRCVFEHRAEGYGENLAADSRKLSVSDLIRNAVDGWMSEKRLHRRGSRECMSTGSCHYTQVVWHKTRKVGCAMKKCSYLGKINMANAWWIVCRYDPRGNIPGEVLFTPGRACAGCPSMTCSAEGLCVPSGDYCEDENDNCKLYKDSGNCENNPDYMKLYCMKTCSFCKTTKDEVKNETKCTDHHKGCASWRQKGYCQIGEFQKYVKKTCPKSCDLCYAAKKPEQQSCTETNKLCGHWKKKGYCTSEQYSGYVRHRCPNSCNSCPGKEKCNDRVEACVGWARSGYCTKIGYITYMERNCRRSCRICTGTGGNCADDNTNCDYWSRVKYCDSGRYQEYVRKSCRKSCRLC